MSNTKIPIPISVAFGIGDTVSFQNKIGRDEGMVTGYIVRQDQVMYLIVWSDKKENSHYDFELTKKI